LISITKSCKNDLGYTNREVFLFNKYCCFSLLLFYLRSWIINLFYFLI